jgi:hypothetical protein
MMLTEKQKTMITTALKAEIIVWSDCRKTAEDVNHTALANKFKEQIYDAEALIEMIENDEEDMAE